MKKRFELSKEKRENLKNEIKTYFYEERDEELGDLAANMILEFFMDKLATEFYNQGVEDSYKYIIDRAEDLLGIQK
ncbi:DUF2164 domain-containing protein [Clostridium carnis]